MGVCFYDLIMYILNELILQYENYISIKLISKTPMESSVKIFIPMVCSDLVDSEQGSTSNSSEKQLPHSADEISGKRGN